MLKKIYKLGELTLFKNYREQEYKKHTLVDLFWECTLTCNAKCKHCGSSAEKRKYEGELTTEEIKNAFKQIANDMDATKIFINVTGGEPLLQDVGELLTELSNHGHYVVVETNGSKSITPYRHIRNVSFVLDAKSVSSGESEKMLEDNYALLNKSDYVKFVIDTEEDYMDFSRWMVAHDYLNCNVAVGLFWGSKMSYVRLMDRLMHAAWKFPVQLNMQAHKMTCMYDKYKSDESFSDLFIPKDI